MKLLIEDWHLHNTYYAGKTSRDTITNRYWSDIEERTKSFRVIGTAEQIEKDIPDDWEVDEVYDYKKIEAGSFWDGIVCGDSPDKPSREEYNAKVDKDYERYEKLYKLNGNKLLILRTC